MAWGIRDYGEFARAGLTPRAVAREYDGRLSSIEVAGGMLTGRATDGTAESSTASLKMETLGELVDTR